MTIHTVRPYYCRLYVMEVHLLLFCCIDLMTDASPQPKMLTLFPEQIYVPEFCQAKKIAIKMPLTAIRVHLPVAMRINL